jgi:iron complex outermembrane receptor protein
MAIRIRTALLVGTSALALSTAVRAQTVPGTPVATKPAAKSEEIIVTAQRRSERLSKAPVAVTVLSANTLAKAAITTETDLQIATPGLEVRAGSNANQLNYAIRGQSLDAYSSALPGVLPYFNEVQIGGSGSSGFYDLQSVQVLKGPQGTLFGRNATGGAVLFQSQKPTDTYSGYISVAGGTWGAQKYEGAVNAPLVKDKVLLRIAGFFNKRDGFQDDIYNGTHRGDVDRYGFRGSLTVKPTENITNTLVVDYAHVGGDSAFGVLRSLDAGGAFPTTSLYTGAKFPPGSGPLTGTSVSDFVLSQVLQGDGLPAAVASEIANGNYARYIASHPGVDPAGIEDFLQQQNARGPYEISSDQANTYLAHNLIITDATTYDIDADTQLRNIFGFTHLNSHFGIDVDGTPYNIISTPAEHQLVRQTSDELQLIGRALDGKLSYVSGLYFSDERNSDTRETSLFDIILGGSKQINDFNEYDRTYAAYSQGTYDLSSLVGLAGFSATGGLRFTNETAANDLLPRDVNYGLALTGIPTANPPVPASDFADDQSKTIRNISYTFGLNEQLNPNLLLYVKTRRSYKDGGYNGELGPRIGNADVGGNGYRTEVVSDVEVGSKYSGTIGDIPVRANAAAYYDWIRDDQRTDFALVTGALAAVTVNVPRSRVYGFELDGEFKPISWLSLGGSVNYTNAAFEKGQNLVTVQGQTTPYLYYTDTPTWSGDVFGDITIPLQGDLTVLLHADMYAQEMTETSSTIDAPLPGYVLTNFRVGIENDPQGWSLTANVKNAFDRVYYVGGLALGALVQTNTAIPGDRRTFLAEFRYKF